MADLTAQNKWEPLATDNSDREKIWSKSRTFAGDVWFRFRRKPTAIAGFVIIIALMLFALVGPLFTPYDYSVQNLEVVNVPPVMKVYQIPNGDYLWGYTQAHREDWEMVKTALDMGASTVRIGFEDSDMIAPGVHVDNNAALIAKVSDIVKSKGMMPMTPDEVRTMLKIPPLRR